MLGWCSFPGVVPVGAKSQRKGRAGELEIVKIFQAHGIDARPGDPVSYGSTPDVVGVDGIHCEIKRSEKLRLTEWLEQAQRDSEKFHDGVSAPVIKCKKTPRKKCNYVAERREKR